MNTQQLKQFIENNAWYGENRRISDPDRQRVSAVLIHPDYTKEWFIDISSWDGGNVRLDVTKELGCSGVWIKAVDGSLNSRYFPENYATAVRVGLPRSGYAWLYRDANVRAVAQAQAFDTLLNRYPPSPELLPWVDFESTRYGGVQSNPDFTDLRKWLIEWLRLGNPEPVVYSGKYYMDQFGRIPADVRGMIAGIAIANYSSLTPPLPLGFTEWMYHQFSAEGAAMLIAPNDVNKQELDLSYGHGVISIPPEPPTGDTMHYGRIKTFTNIRNSPPGGTYQDIGDLNVGDEVTADEIRLVNTVPWWHLKSVSRNGQALDLPGPECWAYGVNIEELPAPAETRQVRITVEDVGWTTETAIVTLRRVS